jgi:hypothetical protein
VQRLVSVACLQGAIALIPEHPSDDAAESVIVLGHQNSGRSLADRHRVSQIEFPWNLETGKWSSWKVE